MLPKFPPPLTHPSLLTPFPLHPYLFKQHSPNSYKIDTPPKTEQGGLEDEQGKEKESLEDDLGKEEKEGLKDDLGRELVS